MLVIGLTGGTGSGKGCVCRKFLNYKINSIDTDKTSRKVCDVGTPCLNELVQNFGSTILNPDRTLNRKALAEIAFSDKQKHLTLNQITHKYILNEVRTWLNLEKNNGTKAAIVDAPLLYESGFDKECDVIIAVTAPVETRIKRIIERDNISIDAAKLRLSKQGDDDFYTQKADFVITNNGNLDELDLQIENIYNTLLLKGHIS
ncbi:MAG: dephospho-CoA kinase [Ruminococcaceae bacterium]|nr:dephospho-CoA kinase [Oscillospiraceae bacterium]